MSGSGVVFSLLVTLGLCLATIAIAQDEAGTDPWTTIAQLRASGDFAGALAVARDVLADCVGAADTPAYALGDARREVATLAQLVAADPAVQSAMAEAARQELAVFEDYERDAFTEAAAAARTWLELSRRHLGDRHHETADAANAYATMLDELDELEAANDLFTFANDVYAERFEPVHPGREALLTNWSLVLAKLWRREESIARQRLALALARELSPDDPALLSVNYNNLGAGLMETGRFEESEEMLAEALRLRIAEGDPDDILQTRVNLALLAYERGDRAEARRETDEAIAFTESHRDLRPRFVAATLKTKARLLMDAQDYAEAVRIFQQILAIRREIWPERTFLVAYTRVAIGLALANQGRFHEADAEFAQGIPDLEALYPQGNPELVVVYRVRAYRYWLDGRYELAAADYARAVQMYERVRFQLGEWGSLETFETPWFDYAASLLMCGRPAEAWQALEAGQGRLLADALRARRAQDLEAGETARLRELSADAAAARRILTELPGGEAVVEQTAASFEDAITRLRAATAVLAEYQAELSRSIVETAGRSLALGQFQQALAPDEAIIGWLQYASGESAARAWGYVVRSDGPVHWVDGLPVARAPDQESAAQRCALAIRGNRAWAEFAAEAWNERIAPLLVHLQGVDRLIVAPTGDMLGVPAEILGPPNEPNLGERFQVSYTPSAEVLVRLRAQAKLRTSPDRPVVLALGDPPFNAAQREDMEREASGRSRIAGALTIRGDGEPDRTPDVLRDGVDRDRESLANLPRLWHTRSEAIAVERLGGPGSLALVGVDCSERRLDELVRTDALRRFDVVHIASHAIVHPDSPQRSSLVLSQLDLSPAGVAVGDDGLVTALEIATTWRLDARLVALTGCETGLGRHQLGEGFLGFTNVFLQRGADAVLVSLWPVRDHSTELLATRFYELYLGGEAAGRTKAACLQEAKTQVQQYVDELNGTTPYTHPQYWAGWVLIGNPD